MSQFIEMFGDPMVNDKQWSDYPCLSEVTQIVLGSTPNSKEPSYWDGDIRWITPAEMTDQSYYIYDTVRHITEEGRDAANLTMLPEGAVLFSTRAPIGKVAIVGKEMCCNQGFKNFICSEKLNKVFLYYTLKYKKDHLCSLGTGTTFKELSKKTVESLKIAVPPIDLQERFEDIYNQADKSEFDGFKSQFIEMFKNEKMVPLGKFCSIEKGSTITRNEVSPGDIPVVAGGQEPSCYHNVSNREAGMITVSASGAYAGFVNYWTCPIFASDCNTISPKEKNATDTTFLFYGMKALQKHIYGLQKGGAQPHVYGKDLQNLLFPLPTIDKQSSFSIIAQQADKSEFELRKSIDAIDAVIKSLINS